MAQPELTLKATLKLLARQRNLNQLLIHKLATLSETVWQEPSEKGGKALQMLRYTDLPDDAWVATMNLPVSEIEAQLAAYKMAVSDEQP